VPKIISCSTPMAVCRWKRSSSRPCWSASASQSRTVRPRQREHAIGPVDQFGGRDGDRGSYRQRRGRETLLDCGDVGSRPADTAALDWAGGRLQRQMIGGSEALKRSLPRVAATSESRPEAMWYSSIRALWRRSRSRRGGRSSRFMSPLCRVHRGSPSEPCVTPNIA
jgi:hypothetical protein